MDEFGKSVRPRGVDMAKVIPVIETRSIRGRGEEDDPVREVFQYWDFDGKLLAERDSFKEGWSGQYAQYGHSLSACGVGDNCKNGKVVSQKA
ncbi:hypothetical protein QE152_g40009 [Popillia japonica]|uniref:Uncharacterized protein n=1 Tax=Popillia japonica TaxID=7064 RepID=A0AAW1HSK2_POPJA